MIQVYNIDVIQSKSSSTSLIDLFFFLLLLLLLFDLFLLLSSLLEAGEVIEERLNKRSSLVIFIFNLTFSLLKYESHPVNIFPNSLVSSKYVDSKSYICFSISESSLRNSLRRFCRDETDILLYGDVIMVIIIRGISGPVLKLPVPSNFKIRYDHKTTEVKIIKVKKRK